MYICNAHALKGGSNVHSFSGVASPICPPLPHPSNLLFLAHLSPSFSPIYPPLFLAYLSSCFWAIYSPVSCLSIPLFLTHLSPCFSPIYPSVSRLYIPLFLVHLSPDNKSTAWQTHRLFTIFYNATIFTKDIIMMMTKTVTYTASVDLVTADQSLWIESALMQFSPVLKITWHTLLALPPSPSMFQMWHLGLKSTLFFFSGLRFGFLEIRSQSKGLF